MRGPRAVARQRPRCSVLLALGARCFNRLWTPGAAKLANHWGGGYLKRLDAIKDEQGAFAGDDIEQAVLLEDTQMPDPPLPSTPGHCPGGCS